MPAISDEAMRSLRSGDVVEGFVFERAEDLPEIDGTAYLFRHGATGMPLMWLANDDENKSFSIAFRTPPVDDTGVFHILEHSVLCGSDRFPVKEPFVNLLKSSMQTFLNALTFSDKTMYPVASTNEQDLLNLMDVYLDAVLSPRLTRDRSVFEQEGWHLEAGPGGEGDEEGAEDEGLREEASGDGSVESEPDPASPDAPEVALRYNGVVFNEMKGALADPDSVALNGLCAALFPDTCYRFESGGNPLAIPSLTYESYLDTYRRHYDPSNALAVLYGDLSLTRELSLLDGRYLRDRAPREAEPNTLELQAPVVRLDAVCRLETEPENKVVLAGFVIGTARDRERCLACEILVDALMGSNEAPLKRALLETGLGDDYDAFVYSGILQPFVVFEVRGAKPGTAGAFEDALATELTRMADEGIPRDALEASLESTAFDLRERDYGQADGVTLAINAMAGWLYDDAMPTDYLRYEESLANLRAGLDTGYWEALVRETFVESNHHALCELIPLEPDDPATAANIEEDRLTTLLARTDDEGISRIEERAAELRRIQDRPDSEEGLATLPRLRVEDVGPMRSDPDCEAEEETEGQLPFLYHTVPTRRIDYANSFFDLSAFADDELPYVSLALSLLGKMPTERRTAAQLDTLIESRLGSLTFAPVVYEDCATGDPLPRAVITASAVEENLEDLIAIPREVWSSTLFDDVARIKCILQQQKLDFEQSFLSSGHSYALGRAWSYVSRASKVGQSFGGVDYYLFVKRLLAEWDDRCASLPALLSSVRDRVFVAPGSLHSFTGDREGFKRYRDTTRALGFAPRPTSINGCEVQGGPLAGRMASDLGAENEAFAIPTDICFSAKVDGFQHTGARFSGVWKVAARALNYDYLWNTIRVKGGAYGCGFRMTNSGLMGCYTYRDPNLDSSIDAMSSISKWVAAFGPSKDEMDGYIISTVAGLDAPVKPKQVAMRQDIEAITHRDPSWRKLTREEVLEATVDAVRSLAEPLERFAESDHRCVFGSGEIIGRSRLQFAVSDMARMQ